MTGALASSWGAGLVSWSLKWGEGRDRSVSRGGGAA